MRFSHFLLASMGLLAPSLVAAQEVCFQEVVGSTGTYAEVSAALDAWSAKAYASLGLTGDREVSIGWAQIPDRTSFENGCDGPYPTMADLFVHINPANAATDYATLTAKLETFIAANPLLSYPAITCRARSITTELPTCQVPTTPIGGAGPNNGPDGTVCYQTIVGSLTGTYAQIDAAFLDWANKAYAFLGLSGERDVHINWAQVPDRVSFENGCDGPFATVADLFVHVDSATVTGEDYASLVAKLEVFIAANPITTYPAITCAARSITDFIPICGIKDATTAPATTQAPATDAPTTAAPATTAAPTTAAPTTPAPTTAAPTTAAPTTAAPTTASPTAQATTQAPDSATSSPTNAGGESPTPANVVCYQEVVGSLTGSYASISADLDTWQQNLYTFLGLTGPLNLQMGHAQIPDRVSFENGCNGPYANMADLFVHIQTTAAEYDAVSAKLEQFIAANPLTVAASIDCMARSVVTYLPTCGKLAEPITPIGPAGPQPGDKSVLCFQEVVGSLAGSYAQVSAQLDAWEQKLYVELGLSGPLNLNMGHAQIPDRVDFENGCSGPYTTMADLFVYIPTTFGAYDALAARLETFIANNPFNTGVVACSARSNVLELPYCGKIMNPGTPAPGTTAAPGTGSGAAAGQGQTCPAVAFTPTASATGIDVVVNTPGVTVTFMDVHITTSTGFYNYRMSSSSPTAFSFTFPSYITLGAGQSISYWFTTASTSAAKPAEFACDSASFSYTTDGTPVTAPNTPNTPTTTCPSIAFDYAIERTGAGAAANAGLYAITFAAATPNTVVDWVDVHITANGGSFNYRMDTTTTGFVQALPSPHLELTTGTAVQYSFTYQANGAACDTAVYSTAV